AEGGVYVRAGGKTKTRFRITPSCAPFDAERRVVEGVVHPQPILQRHTILTADPEILEDRDVPVIDAGASNRVFRRIADAEIGLRRGFHHRRIEMARERAFAARLVGVAYENDP